MTVSLVIGFDRRIKLEWLDSVAWKASMTHDMLEIRTYLENMLEPEHPSQEARDKTIGVLTRIWARVPERHRPLQEQAFRFLAEEGPDARLWLHWGMTLLAYPFFRDIADIIGRLLILQNEISLGQIRRRLCERWGERSTVLRACRRVVRSMVDWGVLEDTHKKGIYVPGPRKAPVSTEVQLWFLAALLSSLDSEILLMQQVPNLSVAFPFHLDISEAAIRKSKQLEVQRQGLDVDIVTIARR